MTETVSLLAETRTEVIAHHVRRLTRETRTRLEDYSEDVLALWLDRTPDEARGEDFHGGRDVIKRMAANTQKLRRWFNPQVSARPSVDVEEALVLALPEPYRAQCLQALALRYGGVFWRLPAGASPSLGCAAELLQQCGEALSALAPALADNNEIDSRDPAPVLLAARRELLDVQAVILSLVARIDAALDQQRAEAAMPTATSSVRRMRGAA